MEFHDFQLRAWRLDHTTAQVLVHSSPVGDLREPVTVPLDPAQLEAFRTLFSDSWGKQPRIDWQQLIYHGRFLAAILLPPPIYILLIRSLERIPDDDGIRLRLCLDETLVDLPWEYLYRPDATGHALKNFLALDARISLVREAPRLVEKARPSRRKQQLLFAGAPLRVRGIDLWKVETERQQLVAALQPVQEFVTVEAVSAPQQSFASGLVGARADIFHYSGHAEIINGNGVVVEEICTTTSTPGKHTIWENPAYRARYGVDRLYVDLLDSAKLAQLLRRSGTRLAVLSACNSGRWPVVEPLLREGIPVVVGTQGYVVVAAAIAFFHTLYAALAIGLSLDEAITWARLHLLEAGVLSADQQWHWGTFMVYMLTPEATLFPKPQQGRTGERQAVARQERAQTIINVNQYINTVQGGQVIGVQGVKI